MITELYLQEDTLAEMRKSYVESGGVLVLSDFFDTSTLNKILEQIKTAEKKSTTVLDKYSCEEIQSDSLREIFDSEDFKRFVSSIIGKEIKNIRFSVQAFSHRDFTLLHDEQSQPEGTEFCFFLCDSWDTEFGGNTFYATDEGESLFFTPQQNTFCLIDATDTKRFVKYVNHLAGNKTFIRVIGSFS